MNTIRWCSVLLFLAYGGIASAQAQTTRLLLSDSDFVVTPAFNNVPRFSFEIELDGPLVPGTYENPPIVSVFYTVTGSLMNTPSGFPSFALERNLSGSEFYAQGSSLSFEIDANAVFSDGVQVAELSGTDVVFTFNGREVGNGRFHPALLELNADGTGRIQNSDNVISENPFQQVDFGEEYVTNLTFDAGNLTLLTEADAVPQSPPGGISSGGGSLSPVLLGLLCLFGFVLPRIRRKGLRDDSSKGQRDSC